MVNMPGDCAPMLILLALIEGLLLALIVFGDAVLLRAAIRNRRVVYVPAIALLTAFAVGLGYVLAVTLAFQECVSQENGCFS
jgi:hypothetical protein